MFEPKDKATMVDKAVEILSDKFSDVKACPADHTLFEWDCWCGNKVHKKACWKIFFRDNVDWRDLGEMAIAEK